MRLPWSRQHDVICPHCLAEFAAGKMRYRDDRGTLYDRPPRRVDGAVDKVCPHCGRTLPLTSGDFPSILIGLAGGRASGKSTYVGTLVHQIRNEVGARFGCTLQALDTETQRRYETEFALPLWEHGHEVQETALNASPLLYEMRFLGAGGSSTARGAVTLAFYDTAGEAFEQMRDISTRTPYLDRVGGLILFIDPLQAPEVREQVTDTGRLPPLVPESRPSRVVTNIASVLRQRGLLEDGRPFRTPVAVTLTKSDVLRDIGLIEPQNRWLDRGEIHDGVFDPELHEGLKQMWEERIRKWAPAAHQAVSVNFQHYAFFGVSATGCSPDEFGNYPEIAPWRVEEPLLWLLWKLGLAA